VFFTRTSLIELKKACTKKEQASSL